MTTPTKKAEDAYRQRAALVKAELVGLLKPSWHKVIELRVEYLKEAMVNDSAKAESYARAITELRRLIADTSNSDPND